LTIVDGHLRLRRTDTDGGERAGEGKEGVFVDHDAAA